MRERGREHKLDAATIAIVGDVLVFTDAHGADVDEGIARSVITVATEFAGPSRPCRR